MKVIAEIEFSGRAALHADLTSGQIEGRVYVPRSGDHETLTVVIGHRRKFQSQIDFARHRPGRISGQDVNVARLQSVKRSFADTGEKLTVPASLKIAADSARQKSTSNPTHSRFPDCAEKPTTPCLTPHVTLPRCLMVLSVCECAVPQ